MRNRKIPSSYRTLGRCDRYCRRNNILLQDWLEIRQRIAKVWGWKL